MKSSYSSAQRREVQAHYIVASFALLAFLFITLSFASGFIGAAVWFWYERSSEALFSMAILGPLATAFLYGGLRNPIAQLKVLPRPPARIVPYFRQRVGSRACVDAYVGGGALAAHRVDLNVAADELDVPSLDAFGYRFDRNGRNLEWHAPGTGLTTVRALLGHRLASDALADLRCLEAALVAAMDREIPFRLVVRVGGGMQADFTKREEECGHFG